MKFEIEIIVQYHVMVHMMVKIIINLSSLYEMNPLKNILNSTTTTN